MRRAHTTPRASAFAALAVGLALGLASGDVLAQPGRSKTHAASARPTPPSSATDDAKLRSGIALFKAHDHKRALAELERLYTTTKKARALYWIGRVHEAAGRPASALQAFKRYEQEGGSLTTATQHELTERTQTLQMQVGTVAVTAPAGASISLDDAVVGTAPIAEPIFVDPGKHTVAANGGEAKTIEVTADSRVTVELSLPLARPVEPAPAAFATTPAPTSAPIATAPSDTAPTTTSSSSDTERPSAAFTIGGIGLAGLLAAGSVYFSIKTVNSSQEAADMKRGEASRAELDDLESRTRLQAGLAVGLGVSAAIAAGVTFVVFRMSGSGGQSTRVVTTGNGLSLVGKF